MAIKKGRSRQVFELQAVAKPTPKNNEVLIRIRATTVMATGFGANHSIAPGTSQLPHSRRSAIIIPGQDLAGEVEAVGRKVTRFRKGDQIIAWSGLRLGTYAEHICLPERWTMFKKPANMTYEEAATLPVGGLDAVYLLRKANIERGEKVLINGAGGSMGTYAVQIAKYFGAEVTGVDSAAKLDMLRLIGTNHVVDYMQKDFTQGGEIYDVIFDVVGNRSFSDILNRLNHQGRYVTAVPKMSQIFRWHWHARRSNKQVICWVPRSVGRHTEDFTFLKNLIEEGRVRAIIDKRFPLEQAAEAHRYVEQGDKKGHVVITVAHRNTNFAGVTNNEK